MPVYTDAEDLLRAVEAKGHRVFLSGVYNLNIIGVRTKGRVANAFDDELHVICWDKHRPDGVEGFTTAGLIHRCFRATTDPGTYWLTNPSRVAGTAILVPGQYRSTYKVDLHAGKYRALCQRAGAVKVYRDSNRDDVLDMDPSTIAEGYFGINIHRASTRQGGSTQVDRWSAGCQVIADPDDFAELMRLAGLQTQHHPTWTTFTYTLIEED